MAKDETIIRFEEVSFEYGHNKPILDAVDFSIRRGAKITLMGQNGAGKTSLFTLITGETKPESGKIVILPNLTIATSRQVIPRADLDLTIREFFEKCFSQKVYDIDPKIDAVLEAVNLHAPRPTLPAPARKDLACVSGGASVAGGRAHDRVIKTFSGGQQARLLLASALIQNPDLLLLDEPTNNLDKAGIEHLTKFLIEYEKTCIVISHDAEFLNKFTQGVLYLDVHTKKIEQYVGNYHDVVKEITIRIEKENRKNAQLAKEIQENKDKANFFANKGGQMRMVAKRMREKAEELEEEKVDTRKEDKTIRPFIIPSQPDFTGEIMHIKEFTVMNLKTHKLTARKAEISLKRRTHLLLTGPNGIGKTTLLETLASGHAKGAQISDGVRIGYYRQDFSTLNFEHTVLQSLMSIEGRPFEQEVRSIAAGFLITGDVINTKIGSLSEGQKGLVAFSQLVIQKPGLLILDEPTNHINFRHIPRIADALDKYEGAMILVSHVPEFVEKIRIDQVLDLTK